MVKKIKLIDDSKTITDPVDFNSELMSYLQAIDWKLWELLKIEQARAKDDGLVIPDSDDTPESEPETLGYKPIRID